MRRTVPQEEFRGERVTETKVCPHCKQLLPLTAFHNNRSRASGRDVWCGACKNEARKAQRKRVRDAKRAARALLPPKPKTQKARRRPLREKIVVPLKYPQLGDEAWLRGRICREFVAAEEVAEELGCALSTVYAAMQRHNVRSPPKGVRAALRARVLQQKQEAQG